MRYTVEFSRHAAREFRKLTPVVKKVVSERIDEIAADPRQHGVEKLSGGENLYRAREGDYRILYEIRDRVLIILIITIGHRKDVYRKM